MFRRESSTSDEFFVDSPGVGTGLQPRPCGDERRPATPAACPDPLAVTLSGGGFRATLAGLGALRLVADIGLLGNLRYLSSVSGGSIVNAVTAVNWPQLRRASYTSAAYDELVIQPVVDKVSRQSLKRALLRSAWRTLGPRTRTDLLAQELDAWFLRGVQLEQLDPEVRWIVSAANLRSGARFTFERDVIGDYTIGLLTTAGSRLPLSLAVAASAAVPAAFAPVVLNNLRFPCATRPPVLLDGGIYDNTGLEALNSERYRHTFLLALNAGGLLRPGGYGKIPIMRDLMRANSLLYRQSTALRTREMVQRFQLGRAAPAGRLPPTARRGVLVGLATDFAAEQDERLADWRAKHPEVRTYQGRDLSLVPTVFDRLDPELCRALVYRGWWLMGAALTAYHPERLPNPKQIQAPEL